MACYHPKIRIEYQNVWLTAKDGHQYKKGIIMSKDNYEHWKQNNEEIVKISRIPCGQCIGCRLEYSKNWATRCMLEAKEHPQNWFITLTYDNEHLPIKGQVVNDDTGEIYYNDGSWKGTLNPEHMQKFIKDLRRYYKYHYNHDGIRFFYCGEYGETTERPHYHIILFNLPIEKDKLKYKFTNEEYQPIYECEEIQKIWGRGLIGVGAVTFSSCAYVARYVTKKKNGARAKEEYLIKGQIPEFVRMSRKPGISRNYYEENKENIYNTDVLIQSTCKGNILKVKPPKYYDKLYDLDNPERMEQIKDNRKKRAEMAENVKFSSTTTLIKHQLQGEEKTKLLKTKILTRKL